MIIGPFYTYRRIHFTSQNASFLWYLSVCLSVCHVPHISLFHSILEHRRKFIFYGEVTPWTSEWWSNFEIKVKCQSH